MKYLLLVLFTFLFAFSNAQTLPQSVSTELELYDRWLKDGKITNEEHVQLKEKLLAKDSLSSNNQSSKSYKSKYVGEFTGGALLLSSGAGLLATGIVLIRNNNSNPSNWPSSNNQQVQKSDLAGQYILIIAGGLGISGGIALLSLATVHVIKYKKLRNISLTGNANSIGLAYKF